MKIDESTRCTSQTNVGGRFIVSYTLAFLGMWIGLMTPPIITIALRLAELSPDNKEKYLAMVLGMGAIVAMFSNPVAGMLSDRTTSPHGMRKPWMIGGVLVGAFGTYLIAVGNFTLLLIGWCIAQAGFNAVLAALTAVLPDKVPRQQRGMVSGLLGLTTMVGMLAGVAITKIVGGSTLAMFIWPSTIAVIAVTVFSLFLDDRKLEFRAADDSSVVRSLRSFWISPRASPDFALAFASRFLLFVGLATLMNNQVYFLMERLGTSSTDIPEKMLIAMLTTTVATVFASVISGFLSDRLGRRKPFVLWAAVIYCLGLLIVSSSSSFDYFLIGIAVCGLGQGSYLAVDLALVTEVLPNKDGDTAKDLGIFNLASAMPQSLAPTIAPFFLSLGVSSPERNYGALFVAAALFALAGAAAVVPIRNVR